MDSTPAGTSTRLDVGRLLETAEQSTGLSDWGDDQTWRVGLEVLVDALEALPTPPREAAAPALVGLLSTRLHLVDDARAHPEVADVPVQEPVVVMGLPRSGTTVTYDLLALDPAARSPLEWEASLPWPAPEPATYDTDPRIAQVQANIDFIIESAPRFVTFKNPWSATTPAECNTVTGLHFASPNFWAQRNVPQYVDWLVDERAAGKYLTHKRVLQQLAWHRPDGRWTLKAPEHSGDLEGFLSVYPGARLVQTHRDPRRTIASLADMVATIQQVSNPPVDPVAIGASTLRLWSGWFCRGVESRRDPAVDSRVYDVAYRDIVREPLATIRGVHEHFGLPFTETHAQRVKDFLGEHRQNKFGRHVYSLEDFGLTEAKVEEAFGPYLEAYGDYLDEP